METTTDDTSATPLPALQLDYAPRDNESLRLVLRVMAFIFVVWQASHVCLYLFDAFCYWWELSDPAVVRKVLRWIPIAIGTPRSVVALYLLVNGANILRLNAVGRRWILLGCVAQGILHLLEGIAHSIDFVVGRHAFSYGPAYGFQYVGHYWLNAATYFVVYAALFVAFRKGTGRRGIN